jgi:hypothetical protein
MNSSRAANTDKNKKYIEERVREIGGKRGLERLTTEWEDPPDKATGTYNLRVNVPEHDPVVIPFPAYDLRWLTYYPEPGEDVEAFSKNEVGLANQASSKWIRRRPNRFKVVSHPPDFHCLPRPLRVTLSPTALQREGSLLQTDSTF